MTSRFLPWPLIISDASESITNPINQEFTRVGCLNHILNLKQKRRNTISPLAEHPDNKPWQCRSYRGARTPGLTYSPSLSVWNSSLNSEHLFRVEWVGNIGTLLRLLLLILKLPESSWRTPAFDKQSRCSEKHVQRVFNIFFTKPWVKCELSTQRVHQKKKLLVNSTW